MIIPKTLRNFNLFISKKDVAENNYAGLISELTLPKLAIKTEDYRAGGMDTSIPIEIGMEPLSCDFTLAEYREEVLKLFGFFDFETNLTFRGAFDDGKSDKAKGTVIKLSGLIKDVDMGAWKPGSLTNLKANFAASYYQLTMDNQEIIEIDVLNMVRKVNNIDQLGRWKDIISGS